MALGTKNKKWLGYGLYVVLVALALFYYLFPSERVENFIDSSLNGVEPQMDFTADRISPWLPPGLKMSGGRIYVGNTDDPPVFATDRMYIRPQILKMLSGKYNIDFSGSAYRGEIIGTLDLADARGEVFENELTVKDLDLGSYDFLTEKLQHKLSGIFSGNMVYARESANTAANGTASLELLDGQLQFQTPILNIGSVDLKKIEFDLELRNRNLTIVRGELTGSELNGSLTGSIQVRPDVKNSELNLKGTMEPLAEFYRKYPEIRELLKNMKKRVRRGQYFFTITGTLGQPRFRLL